MEPLPLFAIALTLAWLSGLRVYLTVLAVGVAGIAGWVELPPALALCESPWILGLAGLLTAVEFSADKIPGVDSVWDLLNTLARVPVGALLAGATLGGPEDALSSFGLLAGGSAALLSHGLKSGARALINTSPEPLSNGLASLGEDSLAVSALLLVLHAPWLALALLVGVSLGGFVLLFWLLRVLGRRLRGRSTEPA